MIFKKFFLDIYRPMQQQAAAHGTYISKDMINKAMSDYVVPQTVGQVESAARQEQTELARQSLGLAKQRLGSERESFETSKRLAPYSLGLGAINVGLQGITSWQQAKRQKELEDMMTRQGEDLNDIRRRFYLNNQEGV